MIIHRDGHYYYPNLEFCGNSTVHNAETGLIPLRFQRLLTILLLNCHKTRDVGGTNDENQKLEPFQPQSVVAV